MLDTAFDDGSNVVFKDGKNREIEDFVFNVGISGTESFRLLMLPSFFEMTSFFKPLRSSFDARKAAIASTRRTCHRLQDTNVGEKAAMSKKPRKTDGAHAAKSGEENLGQLGADLEAPLAGGIRRQQEDRPLT